MFESYRRIIAACLLLFIVGCQTTHHNGSTNKSVVGQLEISEPLAANVKNEMRLARLSDLLSSGELKPEHRAQAFFERGVLYDSFGLPNLARIEFNRALRINPQMADAYNFVGIHLTMAGQFNKAYEAFDATLELEPDHQYIYLNRGISLYYGGHDKLALEDLVMFHQIDITDPYRVIWRYIAEQRLNKEQALATLRENQQQVGDASWGKQIGELFLMNISPAQFMAGLTNDINNRKELAERLCEAYFYLGIYARIHQQPELALNYFKLSLATNVFEFVEHRYARRELLETRLQIHQQNLLKQEVQSAAK